MKTKATIFLYSFVYYFILEREVLRHASLRFTVKNCLKYKIIDETLFNFKDKLETKIMVAMDSISRKLKFDVSKESIY